MKRGGTVDETGDESRGMKSKGFETKLTRKRTQKRLVNENDSKEQASAWKLPSMTILLGHGATGGGGS
jgi:hypothetical protein